MELAGDEIDKNLSSEEIKLIDEIENIKENLDSSRIAVQDTTFYDKTIDVKEIQCIKLKVRKNLKAHLAKLTALDWSTDSQHLVTAAQDGKLIVWDSYSGNKLHMISLDVTWVMACAFSPSQRSVCSGGLDNFISIFDLEKFEEEFAPVVLSGHDGYISYLQYFSEDKLISGSGDKTCKLWDLVSGTSVTDFKGHEADVVCLNMSKTEPNLFVTSSADKTCRLWDLRIAGKYVQVFEGHNSEVNGVCFFPKSSYGFVSGSDDKDCRLWDLRSDQCIAIYRDDYVKSGATSVTLSKSGRLIIAGYDDYTCSIWDLLREESVGNMSQHDNRISAVKTNPSGFAVATASWDQCCFIWSGRGKK